MVGPAEPRPAWPRVLPRLTADETCRDPCVRSESPRVPIRRPTRFGTNLARTRGLLGASHAEPHACARLLDQQVAPALTGFTCSPAVRSHQDRPVTEGGRGFESRREIPFLRPPLCEFVGGLEVAEERLSRLDGDDGAAVVARLDLGLRTSRSCRPDRIESAVTLGRGQLRHPLPILRTQGAT
jgi:hypothetical protein